jgi:autotransporter-associated beta strand protein
MKTQLITFSSRQNWFRRSVIIASLLAVAALPGQNTWASDIVWDGGVAGTSTSWRTVANWNPDGVPTSTDNAIFDSLGTVTTCAIDMGAAGGTQQVGSVTMGSGRGNTLSIRNLTTSTTDGTLALNGIGGILLSNASTATLTFTNASTGKLLNVGLAASGDIDTVGTIQIYSVVSETGGSRSITKSGSGILYLRGVNTYSGTTTVTAGDLEVDDVGTIGNGTNTLFLSGGNLLSGASRNGTSTATIANPIVLTQDAYIQNKAGTATTRFLALSGSLGGSAGTLKIADPTVTPGNTFAVRLFGAFTFNRPIIVGESGYDLSSAFSVMELGNYSTNGIQTFNGDISGVGSIRRISQGTTLAGTSIFTGNNTYSGGTLISSGTLFANNAAGSALGSGTVTVTNQGTLGGNGSVVAPTAINLNGTISPGSTSSNIANLAVSDLTLNPGANFIWQISAATGVAGTAWDLITCSSGWTDAASSGNPVTIKVDSQGLVPTGWSSGTARDWVLIQSSSATGFDASHFALDTTSFSGTIGGVFGLSVVANSLHLVYTPAADTIINVPSGSVTQGQTSPTPYPNINVAGGIVKVGNGEVVLTNSLNSYPGSTKIYAGTASLAVDALNGSGAFGASATAVQLGNTTGNSNATLNINTAGVTMGRSVVVQSGSSGVKTIGTTVASGDATYSGDVTLQDNATLNAAAGGSATFGGNFTGTGGITLGGGGTITMSAVNSYGGLTTLTGGTLNLNAKALGTNTFTISAVSTLDNTSAGSVTLNDSPQNWNANFSFAGTTNLNLGAGPVTMNASRTLTISNSTLTVGGTIAGAGFGLTKAGAGRLSLAAGTNSTYTGGTTNLAGLIAINGTATFGDGTGPLVFSGGNLLNTGTRASLPIANPVVINTDTTIYGDSTATAPSTRILPFTGTFTVTAGSLKVGNTGSSNNTFNLRLQGSNYTTINWPIVVGDTNFDTPGAISQLDLWNDSTTPAQTVSSLISGSGSVRRSATTVNTGGTSILTAQNTFTGGVELNSGAFGLGASSTLSGGAVISGPVGTGTFTFGSANGEAALTVFASGGARVIDNRIFFNGDTNIVFAGSNNLTFTGPVNAGGVAKTLTVFNTGLTTFSGGITNSGTNAGGGLIKAGNGVLILNGNNLYTAPTTVNAGKLLVNNTSGSGTGTNSVTVNSTGTLGGTGIIGGPVIVNTGGTIAAGASIGTLTINNDLTLSGNVAVEVNTSANPSNDLLVVSGVVSNAAAASVTVSNLGPALAVGQKFTVFNSAVANGAAMTVAGGGVNWTNNLAVDGSISVLSVIASVNTNSFAINASVSGNNLNLSWPPDRLGWKVQMQTNSLSTGLNGSWVTVSATASVTNYTVPINPANPTVFIRMTYP